jgi:putative SOS response-associated peptidase YedK
MCNMYTPATATQIARQFGVGVRADCHPADVFPRSQGWFVRQSPNDDARGRELVKGQWGLIPIFANTPHLPYSTNNARSEELEAKASFRQPWARGQRCIIPVATFWEPCWESGKNVWWKFERADGDAFGLAGLWNAWVDKSTGELFESYTMLTLNADHHPLMSRMHKPDPKLPPDGQDKRTVVVLEPETWEDWLTAPVAKARELITVAPAAIFKAEPDDLRAGTRR